MRLLQAMAGRRQGGAERFFARLAVAFESAGVEQQVLIRAGGACAGWLEEGGIRPVALPFGGALDAVSARRFRREVESFRPDVVLTWMNRASAFCPRPAGFVHVGRLGGYYNLKYYRRCQHLIANTRDIVEYVRGHGWVKPVHYLPNFARAASAPAVARGEFDTPEGAPLLLALGRLHRNKGFDLLLEALGSVPGAYLWLAGSGSLAGDLRRLAAALGVLDRVRFLGWRDDLGALHAAADVLVCPSRHEPLGNVVIEAWAHGSPVVAAAAAGPAALIEDGVSGLVVAVDDAAGLAAALRRVIGETGLAARLAVGGREAYEAEFTESIVVARYLSFLDQISPEAA